MAVVVTPAVVFVLLACAIAGWAIARHEGHPVWGALAGLLLGPPGVICVAVSGWFAYRRGAWR